MAHYLALPFEHFSKNANRYAIRPCERWQANHEIKRDIQRLGGRAEEHGFRFYSRRGCQFAIRQLTERWGDDAFEIVDLHALDHQPNDSRRPALRVLLVSLAESNIGDWYLYLVQRRIATEWSSSGMQCSAVLKSFKPNVLLIDELVLSAPRASCKRQPGYSPMRVATLDGEGWPKVRSLRQGGNLPRVTDPAEFLPIANRFAEDQRRAIA